MSKESDRPNPQRVALCAGAQAVINGALVTARDACELEVAPGAYVFTGRALWKDRMAARHPHDALYFALLEASAKEGCSSGLRFRLFDLLSQVVMQDRSHAAQRECAFCASAILSGDMREAVQSASRLASNSKPASPTSSLVPGKQGIRRSHRKASEYAHSPGAPEAF